MSMRDEWRRTDDPPPGRAGQVGGVPYHTHGEYAPAGHQHGDGGLGCLVALLAICLALLFWRMDQLSRAQDVLIRLECAQSPTLELPCPPTKP